MLLSEVILYHYFFNHDIHKTVWNTNENNNEILSNGHNYYY